MVKADGPTAFNHRPELITHKGDPDLDLAAVLDDHLYLLWHLVGRPFGRLVNISVGYGPSPGTGLLTLAV